MHVNILYIVYIVRCSNGPSLKRHGKAVKCTQLSMYIFNLNIRNITVQVDTYLHIPTSMEYIIVFLITELYKKYLFYSPYSIQIPIIVNICTYITLLKSPSNVLRGTKQVVLHNFENVLFKIRPLIVVQYVDRV